MKRLPREKTPLCNCDGTRHFLGSVGCKFAVSEEQLKQDEARIADMIRQKTGSLASDETLMHFIGSQINAYEKQKRDRTRWYWWLAIACLVAALVLAWWEWAH